MNRIVALVAGLSFSLVVASPQDPPAKLPDPKPVAVVGEDGESVASLVTALYAVISGPAGEKRDWDRMRALFHAEGRLVAMVRGREGMRTMHLTAEEYIERAGPSLERGGFFEQEIAQRSEVFGDIAQVWSTYECRRAADDEKPFMRGINSITCLRENRRWWVMQVLYEQEADAGAIPAKYLPQK